MLIPEYFILGVLKDGFEELANDSQALVDIFQYDDPLNISKLQSILVANPKKINIITGFPPAGVKDTTIALTLGQVEEDDQFIAEAEQLLPPVSLGSSKNVIFNNPLYGTMFDGTWRITIYATNADLAVRLSYLIKYILLVKRDYLNKAGLMEQHISIADFEPIPEYLPDIVFVRAIMLKAKTLDTFQEFSQYDPITGFEVDDEVISVSAPVGV